jgi:hypothetical protein
VPPRQSALPPNLAPRLLCREAAAAYAGVSPTTFDAMVAEGSMPPAKRVRGRRLAWDVRSLDVAIDNLPDHAGGNAPDSTWNDVDAEKAPTVR